MVADEDYVKYKDPIQPLNVRIKDLMDRMTLAGKIGQMAQLDRSVVTPEIMRDYSIGNVLSVTIAHFRIRDGDCAALL